MSDQIELVEPLMQGLPKHVGEVKLWSENEWRPWAFLCNFKINSFDEPPRVSDQIKLI